MSFPRSLVLLSLAISNLFTWLPAPSLAQFPLQVTNLTTVKSPADDSITISYREPAGACETVFDTQQQYTGWVNVPGDFPTNIFFWFVAAREPTDLLTIWLNGGPGSSSMFGMWAESGPCEVVELGANKLGTVARQWGWDRASNMLYIDQPNQVGFSYDTPTNGTLDLLSGSLTTDPDKAGGRPSNMVLNGTFSSLEPNRTANTTEAAAAAIWHMLQGFLSAFPEYNPPDNGTSLGVNLFAESYGGKYGPVFAETWQEQNRKKQNGSLPNSTLDINLVSLGIMNGCVDDLIQSPYYPDFAVNNTYDFQAIAPLAAELARNSFYAPDGCRDQIEACRTAAATFDPGNAGNASDVNALCRKATTTCGNDLLLPYDQAGRSYYDIAHELPDGFPSYQYIDYLNSRPVQQAIGSVINYTDTSLAVQQAFASTGDWERGPLVPKISALLNDGVRVGLMYGDRDYICNWMGGEAVSLSIASEAGGAYDGGFADAGYAPIIVNDSYIGGVVRQFGNLSFSRIYQAGHFVPASQPETAFQVFARIVLGTSVSTGKDVNLGGGGSGGGTSGQGDDDGKDADDADDIYDTSGPANATSKLPLPASPEPTCYVRAFRNSCTEDDGKKLRAGDGVVINGVLYDASSDWPGATSTADRSGSATSKAPTESESYTGVFTATATPDMGDAGLALGPRGCVAVLVALAAGLAVLADV